MLRTRRGSSRSSSRQPPSHPLSHALGRIKIRVRSGMTAQAQHEGRFLGGRPPYGYRLADASAHPDPGKGAEGKRLHRLEGDPSAAPSSSGSSPSTSETRASTPSPRAHWRGCPLPGAHDPARNRPRDHRPWSLRQPGDPDEPEVHRPAPDALVFTSPEGHPLRRTSSVPGGPMRASRRITRLGIDLGGHRRRHAARPDAPAGPQDADGGCATSTRHRRLTERSPTGSRR